jgi:hypothetical protein
MSRTPVVGHTFMTNSSNSPDLGAIARQAEAEILIAETLEATRTDDADVALSTAELGYYEAELGSLRDGAARLNEVRHPAE